VPCLLEFGLQASKNYDVIESINMFWLIVIVLLATTGGALGGYFWTKIRFANKNEDLYDLEQELRRQRVEMQRQSYQESTIRINQISKTPEPKEATQELENLLREREREYLIFEQEAQFELNLCREENQALKEELAAFTGISLDSQKMMGPDLFEDAKEIPFENDETSELDLATSADLAEPEESESQAPADPAEPQEPMEPREPMEPMEQESITPAAERDLEAKDVNDSDLSSFPADKAPDPDPESIDNENIQPPYEEFEFHWTQDPEINPSSSRVLPVFQSVSAFVSESVHPSPGNAADPEEKLTSLPGLRPDKFDLLSDLGYASKQKLSGLSQEEISKLSEIFRIPVEVIRLNWIQSTRSRLS
jgi:hypothetical protein